MKRKLSRALILILVLGAAACTSAAEEPTPQPSDPPPSATTAPTTTATTQPTDTPEPIPTQPPVDLSSFGRLAYVAYAPNDVELYLYDDGVGSMQLTDGEGFSLRPVWSPDGRYLSYFYIPPGADSPDLWVIDFEFGGEARQVTDGSAGYFSVPAWMNDSRSLVYWGNDARFDGVYILSLDVESGEIANLTPDYPKWNSHPAASPVDARIAFVSDRPDGSSDKIWVMDAAGGRLKLVAGEEGMFWEHSFPAWSPDGEQLAFFRDSFMAELLGDDDESGLTAGLWVVNVEDGQERLVYEMDTMLLKEAPVWSPDGRWIVLPRGAADETDLWLISVEDGEAIQLSDLPGEETGVVWSPDSASLLFTHMDARGLVHLYIASLDGSPPLLVFEGQDVGYAARRP